MGNFVDVLPGPPAEAQLRNSEWNKSSPSHYSQASPIEKQKQNSINSLAEIVKQTTWKPSWKPSGISIETLIEMDNVFYRWEQDFTCIILRLEVFGALPRYEEIQKINVIMPVMDHVYKVLEALIDIQRAVLHMKYHTSDQYPLEQFNFLVHDGLLQYYQKVWHHYQKALKIGFPQAPYVNHPQDSASPLQQNRTAHNVRAQDENVSSPPHLQSNPQYTHPPQQYHQEHFQNIHENIVQEQNHPPNHEGLGSLVAFQQRNHKQALSGHNTPLTFSRDPDFPLANPQFTHSDNSRFLPLSKFPGNKQTINLQTSELPVPRISMHQSNTSIPRIFNTSEIRHNSFDKNMYGNHSGPIQKQDGKVFENSDLLTSSPKYHSNTRQEPSLQELYPNHDESPHSHQPGLLEIAMT